MLDDGTVQIWKWRKLAKKYQPVTNMVLIYDTFRAESIIKLAIIFNKYTPKG